MVGDYQFLSPLKITTIISNQNVRLRKTEAQEIHLNIIDRLNKIKKNNKTARIRAKPRMFRLPFKVVLICF